MTIHKMAELFSGPGGLARGAIIASENHPDFKIKPIWANDIHEDSCNTYVYNIHNGDHTKIYNCGVEDLIFENLPKFDGLSFGFPCNDFSIVGSHKGTEGKFGPLYSYGVKAINVHNPIWFVAENVGGIRSANSGNALKLILKKLENAGNGYNLSVHLYKFEKYGLPQKRHRIVIVGIQKKLHLSFKIPAPIINDPKKYISCKSAIENPLILPGTKNHIFTKQSKKVIERLKFIPPGKNAWYEGIPKHLRLKVKGAKLSQIYKRLDPDLPSYTITGSGGGGTHVYHWSENRALTNRERARLQTFDDDFIFFGSKESVRRQIGMAVPVKGASIIFNSLIKTLKEEDYKSISPNMV